MLESSLLTLFDLFHITAVWTLLHCFQLFLSGIFGILEMKDFDPGLMFRIPLPLEILDIRLWKFYPVVFPVEVALNPFVKEEE